MRTGSLRRSAMTAQRLIPSSGDLEEFVRAWAQSRGRPIVLLPIHREPNDPSGVWIAMEHTDYIAYDEDAPAASKAAIVCHEVAHMLLDHAPEPGTESMAALAAAVAPTFDPAVAARFLRRHGYASDSEADAENLGTRLAAELAWRQSAARGPRDRVYDRMR